MKIVFFPSDENGCGYYRIIIPAEIINANKLAEVKTSFQVTHELMEWGDIFVWQRQYKPELLNAVKQYQNKKHIFELDDDVFSVTPDNPSYSVFQDINIKKTLTEFLRICDHVTCSTIPLQKELLKYNKNVSVLPNSILPNYMRGMPLDSDNIRVGWFGSAHHYSDLKFLTHVLADICKNYKNVTIVWMGWLPEYIKNTIPSDRLEFHDWVPFRNYLDYLKTLNLDIGLASLDDNIFNKSKSNLRYLEYSLIGACTLASNVYPYSETINNGVDGIIVKKNRYKDWYKALEDLITNSQLRKSLSNNAQTRILNEYNYYKNIGLWMDVYNLVLHKDKEDHIFKYKINYGEKEICKANNIPITIGQYSNDSIEFPVLATNREINFASIKNILVVKLDHIGDFILSLPAIRALKLKFPLSNITLLTSSWNVPIANRLSEIDEIIEFNFFNQVSERGIDPLFKDRLSDLSNNLKERNFDLAIDLRRHPETREILLLSGARYLVGYCTKNNTIVDSLLTIGAIPPQETNVKVAPHMSEQFLSLIKAIKPEVELTKELPVINISAQEEDALFSKYSNILSKKRLIGINPGTGTIIRQWPLDKYSKTIDLFVKDKDTHVVLFGAPSEVEMVNEVYENIEDKANVFNVAGKLSLDEFTIFVKYCKLFIGNNSGSGHIAGLMGTPTFIIFNGQVIPSQWRPLGKSYLVRTELPCSPCYLGFAPHCMYNVKCLTLIEPELVYDVGTQILDCNGLVKLSEISYEK